MSFLGKLFGNGGAKDQCPGESFSILRGASDGHVAFISVNMAYKGFRHKSTFPWRVAVSIPLIGPTPEGLTTNEDADDLNRLEVELQSLLKKACTVHYLGRITCNGSRELLYYVDSPKLVSQLLQEAMDSGLRRPFTFVCEPDPEWTAASVYWR